MAVSKAQTNAGAFLPTTNVWDPAEIQSLNIRNPQLKELLVKLYRNINDIALSTNLRDAGMYTQTEFVNGQLFFPNPALSSRTSKTPTQRQVFRKVINFGALPNSTSKNVAHGITIISQFTFTRIYGAASDPTGLQFIPIPSPTIDLLVNSTNVVVTTTNDKTSFTSTYIIIEYIKD